IISSIGHSQLIFCKIKEFGTVRSKVLKKKS
ncbi:unnamed protein product, partial [marine sediment metagenome]